MTMLCYPETMPVTQTVVCRIVYGPLHSFWLCAPCWSSGLTAVWSDATLDIKSEAAQFWCEEVDLGERESCGQI